MCVITPWVERQGVGAYSFFQAFKLFIIFFGYAIRNEMDNFGAKVITKFLKH